MQTFAHPTLFGRTEDRVVLKGMRCGCGRVAFPYQPYGCEDCGGVDTVEPADLRAAGIVAAAIEVHIHFGDNAKAPFAVGSIKLDDGPMIRARLSRSDLRVGGRVTGRLTVPADAGDDAPADLYFDQDK